MPRRIGTDGRPALTGARDNSSGRRSRSTSPATSRARLGTRIRSQERSSGTRSVRSTSSPT